MVIGLVLVAAAMIVGGGYASYEGYGIILNERGWAMVIAGAVFTSGGFVLLGITLVAARLKRIANLLAERPALEAVPVPASPALPAAHRTDEDEGAAEPVGKTGRVEPTVAPAPVAEAPPRPPAAPSLVPAPSAGDRIGGKAEAPPARRFSLSSRPAVPSPAPAAAAPAAPAADPATETPDPASTTIVGKYDSGGNAYVMYADGSIEAETPTGRYRFKSLDDLKAFIASGQTDPANVL